MERFSRSISEACDLSYKCGADFQFTVSISSFHLILPSAPNSETAAYYGHMYTCNREVENPMTIGYGRMDSMR